MAHTLLHSDSIHVYIQSIATCMYEERGSYCSHVIVHVSLTVLADVEVSQQAEGTDGRREE